MSLMGRGSRAGGNCNTIEKLRGAAGNASRKIIIVLERPRTGQVPDEVILRYATLVRWASPSPGAVENLDLDPPPVVPSL